MVTPLVWDKHGEVATDIDGSVWSLNSESVRGEGRWWWAMERPAWAKGEDLCRLGRQALVRQIERVRRKHFEEERNEVA